jgi:hypothetical protein
MSRYPAVGPYNLLWLAVTRDSSSLCTTAISCQFVYPDTSRAGLYCNLLLCGIKSLVLSRRLRSILSPVKPQLQSTFCHHHKGVARAESVASLLAPVRLSAASPTAGSRDAALPRKELVVPLQCVRPEHYHLRASPLGEHATRCKATPFPITSLNITLCQPCSAAICTARPTTAQFELQTRKPFWRL